MYLKSIEVHGFKSFAHKLVFEFHNGITAIVGPNGSGKSNVADAVRWVLGEQSAKQLRGAKMEDVIFSGTQLRRPQGFAYVAITLDNSDRKLPASYNEVTVARRVYRSGESEYLLNGTNCRLKDVQELFLDTGIGKEGYSIIGQGQIDKILSGKPEERRELFDEAAGIVKFKKRKSAAEKNLEAERQNLCRIEDILHEIETQIVPLEKQSAVAREYLNLREDLKQLEVNMFLEEYDRNHAAMEELEKKSAIAGNDLEDAKKAYEATKEEYDRLEVAIEEKHSLLDEKMNLLSESRIGKEKLEGEIKVLKEQVAATKQNSDHFKERVGSVEEQIKEKTNELKEYEEKKEKTAAGLAEDSRRQRLEEQKLAALQDQRKLTGGEIEERGARRLQLLNEGAALQSKLQHYEMLQEQNNLKKTELNQRFLKNKSDDALFAEDIKKEETSLLEIAEKIKKAAFSLQELEQDKLLLSADRTRLSADKNAAQQSYHRERSRLESLRNITERYDGYGQSIKRVMEQKEKNAGIVGVVADIIQVEKNYETAIETALGGSIQNIVTDNESTAKNLIGYLKQNRFGRATFLPLTTITARGNDIRPEVLKEQGVIGLASRLVKADGRFEGLLNYLLGRIVVVDHIDHAIALGKKYRQTLRIVTVEGDLINPGGSMSGGAYKNAGNLLSRRREMEEFEKKAEAVRQSLKKLEEEELRIKTRMEALEKTIDEKKADLQGLYLLQNTAKVKYDQAVAKKTENQGFYEEIAKESAGMEDKGRELRARITETKEAIEGIEAQKMENEQTLSSCNQKLELLEQEESRQREIVESLKLSYAAKEQNSLFAGQSIERMRHEIKTLSKELESLLDGLLYGTAQVKEKQEEIREVTLAVGEFETLIQELETQIAAIRLEKEEIERTHKNFFSRREELSARMNDLDKEAFRLEGQKEKLTEQLENQINYMWEEYELTYSHALLLKRDLPFSYQQMKKEAGERKNKIRALGDVNVRAIEDYKNMSERFTLLKTQHDDLIESEQALKKIIEELDEEMRRQFALKFEEIRLQFDLVFKEMFGGGKGELTLVEEEDILEAGVRIIAQPPGKKLQNMMQLSGGEKALTAISLLFAIQNLKPSPFCLLDEIEAALDDSNVARFAKYLHKLTKDTQFIVITHRRGTMSAADRLYGITMQEKGISTLVSVDLLEEELDKKESVHA